MANTDSFIAEVAEDIRRDRMFSLVRRYGWIAVLGIVVIVGGTAWREYTKAQAAEAAAIRGDALYTALGLEDPDARAAALNDAAQNSQIDGVITRFLAAGEAKATGDVATASAHYTAIASDNDLDAVYRDMALFKGALLLEDPERKTEVLATLATPGRPYRILAEEQLALLEVQAGNSEAALERLAGILLDAEGSAAVQMRATQLITVLGGNSVLSPGASAQ